MHRTQTHQMHITHTLQMHCFPCEAVKICLLRPSCMLVVSKVDYYNSVLAGHLITLLQWFSQTGREDPISVVRFYVSLLRQHFATVPC